MPGQAVRLRPRRLARPNPRDRVHQNAGLPRRVPILTTIALTATLLGTLTRLFGPGGFDSLRRDPTELGHGQLWRLLTPVLVQGGPALKAIRSAGKAATRDAVAAAIEPFGQRSGGYAIGSAFRYLVTRA